MAIDSTNPNWIEPPPPKRGGLGCLGKSCLFLVGFGVLTILVFVLGTYLLLSSGSKPKKLPIEDLPSAKLNEVQQRVDQFEEARAVSSYTPPPSSAGTPAPEETPAATSSERQLSLTAGEINALISANPKSRGHAYVSLSGNSATVQLSISSEKVPGFPKGYLNGSFVITTNGPTPIKELQVSKVQANGIPIPSNVLYMTYRGQSILGIAMEAAAPYHVSTAEIRDGAVVLH
ncbi:MAG: hypothetical protein H0V54_15250 [Chthoniobacterales bacterium]|nr:hypothetical protein [Chthoniobacterales bacterium]